MLDKEINANVYFCVVFCCHFGKSVENTAVILSHLYVIGLKIVLRDKAPSEDVHRT